MENTNMPVKEKERVRTGPKSKKPEEIHKAVAFYTPQKNIDDFGGIEFAREFCAQVFEKHLARIRSGQVKKGTYGK